jgi:hypothetical protein
MEIRTRQIIGTTAIAGLLMAGGMAGAQAKDGVEDAVDPLTGAVAVDDNGVHGPGHVDLIDQPDDGDAAAAPAAADPAAIPAATEADLELEADMEAELELTKDAEDAAEDAAKDAEDAAAAEDAPAANDDVVPEAPHAEGLDDAPGAADDGL